MEKNEEEAKKAKERKGEKRSKKKKEDNIWMDINVCINMRYARSYTYVNRKSDFYLLTFEPRDTQLHINC